MKLMEYKIEKNIPLPAPNEGLGKKQFPTRDMTPGDSVLFTKHSTAESFRSSLFQRVKRESLQGNVVIRKIGRSSWRVWLLNK